MADQVLVDNGSETDFTVSTDDAGASGQVQRVKLAYSADGSATHIPADADGLRVRPVVAQTDDAAYSTGQLLEMVGGIRRDADTTPVSATGDVQPFVFDELGRLKVASASASWSATTGGITASGQSASADVSRASNVTMYVTGTFAGHNVTFEASIDGGTSWFGIQVVRTNANTIELTSGVLAAAPAYAWEMSVNAYTNVRVRATAHTSGTANWRILPGTYATEPIPAAQISGTQPVSGTVTATPSGIALGVAEDAALSGNAILIGGRAHGSLPTAMSTDNDVVRPLHDLTGAAVVTSRPYASATIASVSASASSVTLLASSATRKGFIIYNNGSTALHIKFGATATTTTSFTVAIPVGGTYDSTAVGALYTGIIDGIWQGSPTGNAMVTSF